MSVAHVQKRRHPYVAFKWNLSGQGKGGGETLRRMIENEVAVVDI